jgi:lactate dehydrogenase-like 2-hydroxyacid dehydrogenase
VPINILGTNLLLQNPCGDPLESRSIDSTYDANPHPQVRSMTDLPELLLVAAVSPALEAELGKRFTLRSQPGSGIRAIVGSGMSVIDRELLARLPRLEIIAIHGVGHDGIDLDAARAHGVRVTLTLDVLTEDVADLAIALMLDVRRRVSRNDRAVREGGWNVPLARRASGQRIGLFGMGRIGQAIARRAAPFAAEILYTSRSAKPVLSWRFVADVETLAASCDVLIVAASAGAGADRAIGAAVIEALGPDGVLINIARGSIVDETALVAALEEGRLGGAGLDVFADEPQVPDALRRLDRVVLSPHQGSATHEGRAEMAALVLANLDAHFAGQPLPSAIV